MIILDPSTVFETVESRVKKTPIHRPSNVGNKILDSLVNGWIQQF